MAQFEKKRGEVGWPNPQARQIEGWAKRYGVDVDKHTAQTGTIYLTLESEDGEEIKVRCADHSDAYCTATYTVDPSIDQRGKVKEWIETNGDDSEWKAKGQAKRKATAILKQFPWINWGGSVEPSKLYTPNFRGSDARDWQLFIDRLEEHGLTEEQAKPMVIEQAAKNPGSAFCQALVKKVEGE